MQLLDTAAVGVRREKMYKLDDHVACAVAGLTGKHPHIPAFCTHYFPNAQSATTQKNAASFPCHIVSLSGTVFGSPSICLTVSKDRRLRHSVRLLFHAADANILINTCRLSAQRHRLTYQEAIPVEQLVRQLCDNKQVRKQYCLQYTSKYAFDRLHE